MDHEPDSKQDQPQPPGGEKEPPPFDPDPRLVTYLERGGKPEAERRFRTHLEKRSPR